MGGRPRQSAGRGGDYYQCFVAGPVPEVDYCLLNGIGACSVLRLGFVHLHGEEARTVQ
jgi:hypothetical protein